MCIAYKDGEDNIVLETKKLSQLDHCFCCYFKLHKSLLNLSSVTAFFSVSQLIVLCGSCIALESAKCFPLMFPRLGLQANSICVEAPCAADLPPRDAADKACSFLKRSVAQKPGSQEFEVTPEFCKRRARLQLYTICANFDCLYPPGAENVFSPMMS